MNRVFYPCIYSISCPISGNIVYIGKTEKPALRFYNHLVCAHLGKLSVSKWVTCVLSNGLIPVFEILEEIDIFNDEREVSQLLIKRENFWITKYRDLNYILLNDTKLIKHHSIYRTMYEVEKEAAKTRKRYDISKNAWKIGA